MNLNLADKVFIVSGSSRGIGRGIVDVLLEEQANVVITGRDKEILEKTYAELQTKFSDQVLAFQGDLLEAQVLDDLKKEVLQKWNRIDGVVANAGEQKKLSGWNVSDEDWEFTLDANFRLARRFVNAFIPELIKTKGNIVFISSIAGVEDIGAPLPYSASKAALNMLAKGLSRELAADGIRVNTIAPGNVFCEGGNWDKKHKENPQKIETMLNTQVALKRFGTPEEIGNLAAFLLSEKSSFTTGSCYVADGGQIVSV